MHPTCTKWGKIILYITVFDGGLIPYWTIASMTTSATETLYSVCAWINENESSNKCTVVLNVSELDAAIFGIFLRHSHYGSLPFERFVLSSLNLVLTGIKYGNMSFTEAVWISVPFWCWRVWESRQKKFSKAFIGWRDMHDCVINDFRCNSLRADLLQCSFKFLISIIRNWQCSVSIFVLFFVQYTIK